MAHSGEGELLVRSLECMIVHQADYTFWNTLLAGGLLKPDTVPPDRRKYVIERPFRGPARRPGGFGSHGRPAHRHLSASPPSRSLERQH